jgi:hypothetical protein
VTPIPSFPLNEEGELRVWMKRKTEKSLYKRRYIVAYRNSVQARLASHKGMISLRELQSQTGEELDALLPSVLRPAGGAFKGEWQKI